MRKVTSAPTGIEATLLLATGRIWWDSSRCFQFDHGRFMSRFQESSQLASDDSMVAGLAGFVHIDDEVLIVDRDPRLIAFFEV